MAWQNTSSFPLCPDHRPGHTLMSTRVPSLVDAPHIDASVKKEIATTDWTDWKLLKSRLVDAVFVGMILVSILGLAYAWLR